MALTLSLSLSLSLPLTLAQAVEFHRLFDTRVEAHYVRDKGTTT